MTKTRFQKIIGQEIALAAVIILLFIVVTAINPRFLSANNLSTIFVGNAYVAVAAIGMSLVIISGHIDVSIGALIGVLATISGLLVTNGYPVWFAWLAPILAGCLINTCLGALIAYIRIPSIIATLAMLSILRGLLITVTGGAWISGLPPEYQLAQFRLLGLPVPIVAMVALTAIMAFIMARTPFGRTVYGVGGNSEAADAVGISHQRTTVKVFAIHGVFAGVAAILFATQLQVIQSTVPNGLELLIISAAVVGGVSILGGIGTVTGSTLAAILFAAIGSALIFVNVSAYWLRAVQGTLILATVLADVARRNRAG
ncbi:putative ABC transporter permease protein [Agrobacterium rubi TR3 = NBRC 13261]|uniref:Autoinducer 2 import system permease protein LsrC n=1 Tax=Agrobacterium rubi TR3 = NBRC 13261 TaxID=1368415 RepID=A0A081D218_9HYPH|nr:ABC transporter permease [Agrobacterium rubi]MBP1880991.1 ribose/xylose/arabinose/galactoside ABC-type transport system permease subunit [Agrobacterium rubi]MCL6653768.1 sugar transporter [Agrobacterium rubi]GAK72964.1 putative ABC transporter permease protein [Agrobacterium rubi TR3 = NBRC 13261]